MFLFERSASYRSKRIGLRDAACRFIHDLATSGVPMALASVKAASDVVTRKTKHSAEARKRADAQCSSMILPIGPLAGLP